MAEAFIYTVRRHILRKRRRFPLRPTAHEEKNAKTTRPHFPCVSAFPGNGKPLPLRCGPVPGLAFRIRSACASPPRRKLTQGGPSCNIPRRHASKRSGPARPAQHTPSSASAGRRIQKNRRKAGFSSASRPESIPPQARSSSAWGNESCPPSSARRRPWTLPWNPRRGPWQYRRGGRACRLPSWL